MPKNKNQIIRIFLFDTVNDFYYYNHPQADVKVIEEKENHSIRTFCCCRDGIVLESSSYDIISLNGSSNDFGKTGKTNIGVLVRAEEDEGKYLRKTLGNQFFMQDTKSMSLKSYMYEKTSLFGDKVDSMVRSFLEEHYPKMIKGKGVLLYPSIEKDGFYPELNDILQAPAEDIWVVGDATGLFRGLLASLVSGFLSANCITTKLQAYDKDLRDNITYKIIDNNGKVYLWSTQCDKPQVNAVYTASIKREQDYKGEHQIVITRARLVEKPQDNERVIVRAIQSGGAIWDNYEEQFIFNSREEYYEWLEENEDCWTFIWEED